MDTFWGYLKLAALGDFDLLDWTISASLRDIFDFVDDIHSLEDFSENDMTSIEPTMRRISSADINCKQFPGSKVGHRNLIVHLILSMQGVYSRSNNSRDEELGAICVLSRIGHGKKARTGVLFRLALKQFKARMN